MKKHSKSPESREPASDRGGASDLLRQMRREADATEAASSSAPPRGITRVVPRDEIEKIASLGGERHDTESFELLDGAADDGLDECLTPPPARAASSAPAAEPAPGDRAGRETRRLNIADLAPRSTHDVERDAPPRAPGGAEPVGPEPDSVTDSQETVTFAYPQGVVEASARAPEPVVEPHLRPRRETERLPLCDVEPTQPDFAETDLSRGSVTVVPRGDTPPAGNRSVDVGSAQLEPTRHRTPAPVVDPSDRAITVVRPEAQVTRPPGAEPSEPPAEREPPIVGAPVPEPDETPADDEPDELDEELADPAPMVVSFLDPAPVVMSFLDPAPVAESFLDRESSDEALPEPVMEPFLDHGSGEGAYLESGPDAEALVEQGLIAEPAPDPAPVVESFLDPAPVVVSFIEPRHAADPKSTSRLDDLPPFALRDRHACVDADRTNRFVKAGSRGGAAGEGLVDAAPSEIVPVAVIVERERSSEREAPTDPVVRSRPAAGDSLSFFLPWRSRRAPPWTYPAAEKRDAVRPSAPRGSRPVAAGAVAFGVLMVTLGLVGGALGAIVAARSGVDIGAASGRRASAGPSVRAGQVAGLTPRAPDGGTASGSDALTPPAAADRETRQEPFIVCDQRFWTGEGGNRALVVSARFTDRDRMAHALDLSRTVGEFNGRPWLLSEVLIDLDLNADGHLVTWRVSGPSALIAAHVDELRRLERSNEVIDLTIADLEVVTSGRVAGPDE
jgi:hypothetical protein